MPLRRPPLRFAFAVACTAALVAASPPVGAVEGPPPVVFEGFGFDGGAASVAAALRQAGVTRGRGVDGDVVPLDLAIHAPTSPQAATPLAAEVRSRIERIDVAAGMRADPNTVIEEGARWTGRIGVATRRERQAGLLESFEVRSHFDAGAQGASLGLQVGPRMEWQVGKGTTLFLDGTAEARAERTLDAGAWALPGTSAADGLGMLGVSARTGLAR